MVSGSFPWKHEGIGFRKGGLKGKVVSQQGGLCSGFHSVAVGHGSAQPEGYLPIDRAAEAVSSSPLDKLRPGAAGSSDRGTSLSFMTWKGNNSVLFSSDGNSLFSSRTKNKRQTPCIV